MDSRVTELHCIMPIGNIASVMAHGILSHARASKWPHSSVAMQVVQDRRDAVSVPKGLKLHEYANLYFHARNPMMFTLKADAANLCVLRVSTAVLEVAGTVITDCNASSTYARYLSPEQFNLLDFDDIFATNWNHPENTARHYQHKSRKCAEVLVPRGVDVRFIEGAYVADADAEARLKATGFSLPITIEPVLFFRQ